MNVKTSWPVILFLFGLFIGYLLAPRKSAVKAQCEHDENTFRCVKYLKNHDGDTLTVEIPGLHPLIGKKISVRVRGIDTPEMTGTLPCEKQRAREAQELIESVLTKASSLELRNVAREKYFRILADVYVDNKNISEILLTRHLAYPYDGGKKSKLNWCK